MIYTQSSIYEIWSPPITLVATMYTIRKSRPEDADRLFDIWETAIDATHDFLSARDRAEIATIVREDFIPVTDMIVAVDESGVAHAFLAATDNHIDALFVHGERRGAGLGSLLLSHFRSGADAVTVDVNEQNPQACGFYESKGFRMTVRSSTDDAGRPYPIIHMRWER